MVIRNKLPGLCVLSLLAATLLFLADPARSTFAAFVQILTGHAVDDSAFYMERAWSVTRLHVPLYQHLFFQQHFKFVYPASSLLLDAAAHFLHLPAAGLIRLLVLFSAAATLCFAGDIFLRLARPEPATSGLATRLLIALLGILFYPLVLCVALTQIQTLLTFLFTLAVWLWICDRWAAAGCAIALICAFKPPLALFLVWAIARRQWRFLAAFAATTLAIQLLTIAVFGWRNLFGYLAVLNYLSHHGEIIPDNQSVNGLLQRWLHNGDPSVWSPTSPYPPYRPAIYLATLFSSAILLASALLVPVVRRFQSTLPDFLLFGLAATIASPIVWTHHYGFFYVACIAFIALRLRSRQPLPLTFVAAFLLLGTRWPFPGDLISHSSVLLSAPCFVSGLVILVWLAASPPTCPRTIPM